MKKVYWAISVATIIIILMTFVFVANIFKSKQYCESRNADQCAELIRNSIYNCDNVIIIQDTKTVIDITRPILGDNCYMVWTVDNLSMKCDVPLSKLNIYSKSFDFLEIFKYCEGSLKDTMFEWAKDLSSVE